MPAEPAILVVDDELATRIALRKVLSGAGYRVIEASSGAEALDRMSTQNAPRPSRALAVDPPQCPAVVETASPPAARRRHRPARARRQIPAYCSLAQPQALGDRPLRQLARIPQPQNFSDLAHRQSLGWHPIPAL